MKNELTIDDYKKLFDDDIKLLKFYRDNLRPEHLDYLNKHYKDFYVSFFMFRIGIPHIHDFDLCKMNSLGMANGLGLKVSQLDEKLQKALDNHD